MDPAPGVLLLAAPALRDPNFRRAVVLLCDHNEAGSFGLVLNRSTDLRLPDVVIAPDVSGLEHILFAGGPVQTDTLHVLHTYEEDFGGALPITPGVSWGGPFETLVEGIRAGTLDPAGFRFFLGYAGWGPGQLAGEIEEGSWTVLPAHAEAVFAEDPAHLWRDLMRSLGGEHALFANFPDDPRMN